MKYAFHELAYANPELGIRGTLKAQNADFCVDEIMPVIPSGEGEHLWLKVEKNGSNTDWVAQQLAKIAGLKPMAVSYAGMKDRHAISTQWFSLHMPGMQDPDLSDLDETEFKVLEQSRHDRKLKRGALTGNRFKIRITELQGDIAGLSERLQVIKQQGVPNYFGEQRFGRDMGNLDKAERLFNREIKKIKKQQRGLYISAARSWIFNQVLSARISQGKWDEPLTGEVYMLNGKSACFIDDDPETNRQRLKAGELNLTGCLWGEGESMASAEVLALEKSVADEFQVFATGLESARIKQERRPLRLMPACFEWSVEKDTLTLSFELPAGAFATMVLRECVSV